MFGTDRQAATSDCHLSPAYNLLIQNRSRLFVFYFIHVQCEGVVWNGGCFRPQWRFCRRLAKSPASYQEGSTLSFQGALTTMSLFCDDAIMKSFLVSGDLHMRSSSAMQIEVASHLHLISSLRVPGSHLQECPPPLSYCHHRFSA